MPRQRIGEHLLNKIVAVKIDEPNFDRLHTAQRRAKRLIKEGERSLQEVEHLADSLRATLYDYIEKLEDFVNDGVSMKEEVE